MDSIHKKELLQWSSKQGHILTGDGKLQLYSLAGRDFTDEDLPHHHLVNRTTWKAFNDWKALNRRSDMLVGAWSRPLFSGGWSESFDHDTEAFNLQTPSIFIDIRIPRARPTAYLKLKGAISACSWDDLRLLARQHCFAGYTLPETNIPSSDQYQYLVGGKTTVFTRHHVIDWNYHPSFPRNRPNRWWVQLAERAGLEEEHGHHGRPSGSGPSSFKEHSTVRDPQGVPVYTERWALRPDHFPPKVALALGYSHLTTPRYLALRRRTPCPHRSQQEGRGATAMERRDAVLVVVGNHFALAVDRDYESLTAYMQEQQLRRHNSGQSVGGGGAAFTDSLWQDSSMGARAQQLQQHQHQVLDESGQPITVTSVSGGSLTARDVAEEYLTLEGSYGHVFSSDSGDSADGEDLWRIQRSTLPWLEGRSAMAASAHRSAAPRECSVHLRFSEGEGDGKGSELVGVVWEAPHTSSSSMATHSAAVFEHGAYCAGRGQFLAGEWAVLECSFSREELERMFNSVGNDICSPSQHARLPVRSKL